MADVNETGGHCTGPIKDARTMTRSSSTTDVSLFCCLKVEVEALIRMLGTDLVRYWRLTLV